MISSKRPLLGGGLLESLNVHNFIIIIIICLLLFVIEHVWSIKGRVNHFLEDTFLAEDCAHLILYDDFE